MIYEVSWCTEESSRVFDAMVQLIRFSTHQRTVGRFKMASHSDVLLISVCVFSCISCSTTVA